MVTNFIVTNHVLLLHIDPNKKPPAPLTSPTPKANKVASPKQPAMPAFNPSQPTEPDWAPKEYLEKGKHYLEINVCTYGIYLGYHICEIVTLFIFEWLIYH